MNLKVSKLEKKIRVNFKNKSLLAKALTHKSADQVKNNEKLEFLGDRVLGLVLSKKIIDLYPDEEEGNLDKRFAKLVNRETCSKVAWSIDIQKYLTIGDTHKKISKQDSKILSDSCEALIGAIYVDKGFDFVSRFILNIWKGNLENSNVTILDSKTRLQEYSLKTYKKLPTYTLIKTFGPRHKPVFKIAVNIPNSKKFIGSGNSKQQAEQDGAKKLLENIKIK
tara:strand:+ start:425 stop:1093 length:669 start_codon:yes stop_codon:yes gene_type:complete